MIAAFGLYAVLALSFTIGRMLLDMVPPFYLIGIRMILAGCLITSAQYVLHKTLRIKRQDIGLFAMIVMVHIFIPYVTEFLALKTIVPSYAALIFNLTPCFSALFSYLIFHEKMTRRKWLGFAIAFSGILFMMYHANMRFDIRELNLDFALLMVSVICGALGWILVKKLMLKGYSPLHVNGFSMTTAGILCLCVSAFLEPQAQLPWGNMQHFMMLLLSIILISNVIFYNLYGFLLRYYSATLLAFVGFMTPLYTALYDWLLLGFVVPIEFYMAAAIVAYGIYIFYQEELQQGYTVK